MREIELVGWKGPRAFFAGATVLALACCVCPPAGAVSESNNYRLAQSTIHSGGDPADSAGFVLTGSHAQAATVGTSASGQFVLQSGFWGHAGAGSVALVLLVAPATIPDTGLQLNWSGITPPYHVYRSSGCAAVLDHHNYLDSAGGNSYIDWTPPETGLVCFKVISGKPIP